MTMPEGETSNTYRITVNALVSGQRMTFEVVLYYANDVTLQMESYLLLQQYHIHKVQFLRYYTLF